MALDPLIAGLVLLAALMHASWNAVVKSDTDRQTSLALVMLAGIPFGLALLPFAGRMGQEAWIWLAGSVFVHCLYYACLLKAYRFGDLSSAWLSAAVLPFGVVGLAVLGIVIAGCWFPICWLLGRRFENVRGSGLVDDDPVIAAGTLGFGLK